MSQGHPPVVATAPQNVAPRPGYRDVLARLAGAQKDSRGAPGYSRWVNRRLGRYVAAWAFLRGMTPNQVTAVSSLFTFASLAVLGCVRPSWVVSPLVALGLLLGYAIDSADGQLARLRGGGSPAGEWLDHVTDAAKMVAIHLVVLIAWFRFWKPVHLSALLIPLGFTFVSVVFFFGVILTDQLRRANTVPAERTPQPAKAPAMRSLLVLPADYGVLCLVLVLLPLHRVFLVLYTALLAANLFFLVGALRNWFRELVGLAHPKGA